MLTTYGARLLQPAMVSNPYEFKYKGIWVCLLMLARAMSGNYVNFGVFDLYGDPALKVWYRKISDAAYVESRNAVGGMTRLGQLVKALRPSLSLPPLSKMPAPAQSGCPRHVPASSPLHPHQ